MPSGTIYTCPMHPEIRQVGPGNCPICGMALEPETVTAETGPNPELVDMTRRFWIGTVVTAPVLALEMGGHLFDLHGWIGQQTSNWVQLLLATPVVLWAGWPFFERGWASLKTRNLNMFTLIAMGTGVAWAYSVVATLAPQTFPAAFRDMHGEVAVYFEAAAVITAAASKYTGAAPCMSRNAGGNRSGASVASTLVSQATPVPIAISVNMLRLRVTSDCQPFTKNGQPAHSTTGVARTS